MKRILYAAAVVAAMTSALSSCIVLRDDDYYHDFYDIRGSEYILYPDNVMRRCVSEPLEVLDYIINIYDTLSTAGLPVYEGAYLLTDRSGYRVGTVTCGVSAEKDTVWTYDGVSYAVKRWPSAGVEWSVSLKENPPAGNELDRCWFDSVMEVRNVACGKATAVRHESEISFSGVRNEDSDYFLEFNSGSMKIRWNNPESYYSATMVATGTLNLSFMENGKEKDWLKAEYISGVISYTKSF